MKVLYMVKAAVLAAVVLFGAGQAQALIVEFSGSFTVNQVLGDAEVTVGQEGSYFYILDSDAPDPDTASIAGEIPNALLGLGFSIGDLTFSKFVNAPVVIEVPLAGELGAGGIHAGSTVERVDFRERNDFTFSVISSVSVEEFFGNFHTKDGAGSYINDVHEASFRLTPEITVLASFVDTLNFFSGTGSIDSIKLLAPEDVGDPGTNPSDPSDPPPVTAVPVPAALPLMLAALGGLFLARFRRRSVNAAAV